MEREEVLISERNGLQSAGLLRRRILAVCLLECIVKDIGSNTEKLKRGSGFYAKVDIRDSTYHGIFTNNHVVSNETEASEGEATFDYDEPGKGKKLRMRPDLIFFTNKELDYTLIGIDKNEVDKLGLDLVPIDFVQEPDVEKGDEIFIFQHPRGRPKEFSHEQIMVVERPFVYYKADTDTGSSGSPVLRNLKLLAVHHKGREGEYNKGTLCSEILEHLNRGTYSEPKGLMSDSQDKEIFEGSPPAKKRKFCPRNLKSTPSEEVLDDLAQDVIPFWKHLGRKLGVPNAKLEEISRDHINYSGVKDNAFQMLWEWQEKAGDRATYGELSKALKGLGKCKLAEKYC